MSKHFTNRKGPLIEGPTIIAFTSAIQTPNFSPLFFQLTAKGFIVNSSSYSQVVAMGSRSPWHVTMEVLRGDFVWCFFHGEGGVAVVGRLGRRSQSETQLASDAKRLKTMIGCLPCTCSDPDPCVNAGARVQMGKFRYN